MAVQLILGPAGSGKTELAVDRLRQQDMLSWCREVRFVVPTEDQKQQVQNHLLSDDAVPGFLGEPVCTFYGFASQVIAEAGLRTKLVSDSQKRLTLADLLMSVELDYFRAANTSPGFVRALDQIIGELKISMIEPQELQRALAALRNEIAPETAVKTGELLRLYQAYQQDILIAKQIHDREGVMWRALQILRDRELLRGYRMFVLDGFDRFTGVQKEFLRLIAEQVPEVLVTLTYEPGRPEVFECVESAVEFVRSLGNVCETRLSRRNGRRSALSTIEQGLFGTRPAAAPCDDSLTILEGGNIRMETEMVAAEITRLAASGVPYDEVMIVARDLDAYYPHLTSALALHSIPFAEPGRPVMHTALAQFVAMAVETCMAGWRRDHVIPILKSPFLSSDLSLACRVEILARQRGLVGGRSTWMESWGTADDTFEYRTSVLAPIARLDDNLGEIDSAAGFARVMKRFVGELQWRDDDRCLAQDAAVTSAIYIVLDELERTEELVGRKTPKEQIRSLFLEGLAAAEYRPADACDGGAALLKAESIGGRKYDVVFVVGLLEKVFPRQVREDPFFRDSERRKLNEPLGGKLAERLPDQARERFLFCSAVTSARKRLYLSYPLSDPSARESLPSFYLDEVRKLFHDGSIPVLTRDVGKVVTPPWEARTQRGKLEGMVYGAVSGEFDAERLAAFYNRLEDKSILRRAIEAAGDTEAGITDPRILSHTTSRRRRFKVTELEDYASCPFKHFCCHVLGLERIEEVTPLTRGIILHEVLCRLFRRLREQYGDDLAMQKLSVETTLGAAEALLDQAMGPDAVLSNLPGYRRDLERRKLAEALSRFLQKEISQSRGEFVPRYFELEFGSRAKEGRERDPDSIDSPLVLNRLDEFIEICGKIDRVDINPQTREAIAVDYKLNTAPSLRDLDSGQKLQAPLYALALKQLFGLRPVGTEYRGIFYGNSSGYTIGPKLSAEEFDERLSRSVERALEVANGISACSAAVRPAADACLYCNLDSVCRIDAWKRLQLQTEGNADGRD